MRFSHWRGLHDFCAFPVLMALQMTSPPGILMTRCSQPCCFQPLKVKTPTNRGSTKLLCMTLSPGSSLCSGVSKDTGRRECYYNCSWRKHEATHPKDKFWQLVLLTAALLALYSVPYGGGGVLLKQEQLGNSVPNETMEKKKRTNHDTHQTGE